MIVMGPCILLPTNVTELPFPKNVWLGGVIAGEEEPRDKLSNEVSGIVFERERSRRSLSVGGRGAGPGFINWFAEYILRSVSVGQDRDSDSGYIWQQN